MEAGEGKGGWPVPGGSPHSPEGGAVNRVPLLWGGGSEFPAAAPPSPSRTLARRSVFVGGRG